MKFTRQLPLRVAPFADESFLGFLGRLMEANGYPRQLLLWKHLGVSKSGVQAGAMSRLASLSSIPEEDLAKTFVRTPNGEAVEMLGHNLPHSKITASPAFCLECFSDPKTAYHQALWDIKWFRACPHHGCLLNSVCPACGQGLLWDRHKLFECSNGHSLAEFAHLAERAEWGTAAEAALEELLQQGEVRTANLPPALRRLPISDFIDVLNVLGGCGQTYSELAKLVGRTVFARVSRRLNRGLTVAAEWPQCLHNYVQQWRLSAGGGRSIRYLRGEIRKLDGTVAGEILSAEWKQQFPELDDIDTEVSDPPRCDDEIVSMPQMGKELGYSRQEVTWIVSIDRLAERVKHAYFDQTFMRRDKLDEWIRQGMAWRTVSDIASRWKIKSSWLFDACRERHIGFNVSDAVPGKLNLPWRIRQKEVDEVEARLASPRKSAPGQGQLLSELKISFPDALRWIRSGKLIACGWSPEQGIGQAKFVLSRAGQPIMTRPAIPPELAKVAEPPTPVHLGPRVLLSQVALDTSLEIGAIKRAYEDGFLGQVIRGQPAIDADLEAVEAFKAKYVSPFQWTLELGLTLNQVYNALRNSKIRPAGKPLNGGLWHRQRFYRRSDLANLALKEL